MVKRHQDLEAGGDEKLKINFMWLKLSNQACYSYSKFVSYLVQWIYIISRKRCSYGSGTFSRLFMTTYWDDRYRSVMISASRGSSPSRTLSLPGRKQPVTLCTIAKIVTWLYHLKFASYAPVHSLGNP